MRFTAADLSSCLCVADINKTGQQSPGRTPAGTWHKPRTCDERTQDGELTAQESEQEGADGKGLPRAGAVGAANEEGQEGHSLPPPGAKTRGVFNHRVKTKVRHRTDYLSKEN